MIDFDGWLDDAATQPLPGGVAVAATAAALGAALVAKTARLSAQRTQSGGLHNPDLSPVVLAAEKVRVDLLDLATS